MSQAPLIYVIAGEASGDQLGGTLMQAIKQHNPEAEFTGIGGSLMQAEGMSSLFPMSDLSVMGLTAVFKRLPLLMRRIRETVADIEARLPDILILIDSPDFTHRVAKRVRKKHPDLKIVNYVSPTVWAWRPGRAKKMRAYIDLVLALLPFEPAKYQELSGPDCVYVGHPLLEKAQNYRQQFADPGKKGADSRHLILLPGSRHGEIARHLPVFHDVAEKMASKYSDIELIIPVAPGMEATLREMTGSWKASVRIIEGQDEKWQAFFNADLALAASGTVTLELALAHVPHIVIYKTDFLLKQLRSLALVDTMVLANLILGEKAFPEYLNEQILADKLVSDLGCLLDKENTVYQSQNKAFSALEKALHLPNNEQPAQAAARHIRNVLNG